MAKTVIINGVTYPDVPAVEIPLASPETPGETAIFRETSGGDVAASDLRAGKTAYGANGEVAGSVPVKSGTDITVNGDTVNVPAGIYDTPASKQVAAGSVTPNASLSGSVIDDTVSDYPVTANPGASVTPGYVSAAGAGSPVTKYVQVEEKSATPSGAQQEITPTAGKLLKKVTVDAVVLSGNATPADVIAGKTFYKDSLTKLTGSATVPTVSQDSQTKILTVA